MVEPARPVWDGPLADGAGFRQWMLVRASALRRKAFHLCGDWSAADDLVQDVLVRALAPEEVALLCFDEAYTWSEFELVPGVDADGVGRLLYED